MPRALSRRSHLSRMRGLIDGGSNCRNREGPARVLAAVTFSNPWKTRLFPCKPPDEIVKNLGETSLEDWIIKLPCYLAELKLY